MDNQLTNDLSIVLLLLQQGQKLGHIWSIIFAALAILASNLYPLRMIMVIIIIIVIKI